VDSRHAAQSCDGEAKEVAAMTTFDHALLMLLMGDWAYRNVLSPLFMWLRIRNLSRV
jgi:hypothetical protein